VNFYNLIIPCLCLCLALTSASQAQTAKSDTDLEALRRQMQEMQTSLQQLQQQHQQEIDKLKTLVDSQQKIISELQSASGVKATSSPQLPMPQDPAALPPLSEPSLFPTTDDSVVASTAPTPNSKPPSAPNPSAFPVTDASITGSIASAVPQITVASSGKSFLNISFDAIFTAAGSSASDLAHLFVGDHDPQHRGFNARNNEVALDGAIDPYFEGFANIVFKLDNANETSVEVEEAFLQSTALPWGLQVKGGQFFVPFGRINPTHPHTWDFADAPLVHGRLLGPDGLRGVGVQASWVTPLPWYSQLLLAIQNGEGGTGYSFRNTGENGTFFGRKTVDRQLNSIGDLLLVPRWENSVDLTPTQTILAGVSAAFGPNDTGQSTNTQIYGADLFYKWKPANAEGGWPYVKWQSEIMWRRFQAGRGVDDGFPRSETFKDWGAYSQIVWGFKKGWAAGIRGDYLHEDDSNVTNDPDRQSRYRISADLTYYPSEFSKLRIQYDHDFLKANHFQDGGSEDSVLLQFEFALGAHGAHKY
jgi:hypothetical protein